MKNHLAIDEAEVMDVMCVDEAAMEWASSTSAIAISRSSCEPRFDILDEEEAATMARPAGPTRPDPTCLTRLLRTVMPGF